MVPTLYAKKSPKEAKALNSQLADELRSKGARNVKEDSPSIGGPAGLIGVCCALEDQHIAKAVANLHGLDTFTDIFGVFIIGWRFSGSIAKRIL